MEDKKLEDLRTGDMVLCRSRYFCPKPAYVLHVKKDTIVTDAGEFDRFTGMYYLGDRDPKDAFVESMGLARLTLLLKKFEIILCKF
jgi:hypothetical protein